MDIMSLFGSGAIMHDFTIFPKSAIFLMQPEELEITHRQKNGIAYMSFSDNYYMGGYGNSIERYSEHIYKLRDDQAINGLIFEQYSGGGSAIAGELLRVTFEDFKAVKPVITLGHAVGSAAYLAALGTNMIIASSELAHFGSIGAVVTLDKFLAMIEKFYYTNVYAEQSPEKNKAWREYLEDNKNIQGFQEQANKAAQLFIERVEKTRPGVKKYALKGEFYNGREAKSAGLIDGIGSLNYAEKRLQYLINEYKKR